MKPRLLTQDDEDDINELDEALDPEPFSSDCDEDGGVLMPFEDA